MGPWGRATTLDRSALETQSTSSGADRAGLGRALPSQLRQQVPHLGTGPGSSAQVRTLAVTPRPTLSPESIIMRPPGDQASPTPNTQPHVTKSPLQPLMHAGNRQTAPPLPHRQLDTPGFKSSCHSPVVGCDARRPPGRPPPHL